MFCICINLLISCELQEQKSSISVAVRQMRQIIVLRILVRLIQQSHLFKRKMTQILASKARKASGNTNKEQSVQNR